MAVAVVHVSRRPRRRMPSRLLRVRPDGIRAERCPGEHGEHRLGTGRDRQQNLSGKVGTPRTPFNLGDGNYHTYRLDYYTDHLIAYIDGVLQDTITQAQVNAAFGPQTA